MTCLSHIQWSNLNDFILELHTDASPDHFFNCCLERLPHVLGIQQVAWNEFNEHFEIEATKHTRAFEERAHDIMPRLVAVIHSHPIVEHVEARLDGKMGDHTFSMSDFVSQSELRNRGVYSEFYRHLGIEDQVYTEIQSTQAGRFGFTLNSEAVFTEEQKLMAKIVRQHLAVAYVRMKKSRNVYSENADGELSEKTNQLSPRLRRVLDCLLRGMQRKSIADHLGLSLHTVNDYVREVYAQLNVHSHAELIATAQPVASVTAFSHSG